MKSMLMAIMAVAVAISFSAPSFADDTKKKEEKSKDGKKAVEMIYAEEKKAETKDGKKAEEHGKKAETKK